MKNPDISTLRKSGVKAFVTHYRFDRKDGQLYPKNVIENGADIDPRGGKVEVKLVKGDKTVIGVAKCSSLDVFNKREGLNKALGRALGKLSK